MDKPIIQPGRLPFAIIKDLLSFRLMPKYNPNNVMPARYEIIIIKSKTGRSFILSETIENMQDPGLHA